MLDIVSPKKNFMFLFQHGSRAWFVSFHSNVRSFLKSVSTKVKSVKYQESENASEVIPRVYAKLRKILIIQ